MLKPQFSRYLVEIVLTKSLKPSPRKTGALNVNKRQVVVDDVFQSSTEFPLAKLLELVLQIVVIRMMYTVINQLKSSNIPKHARENVELSKKLLNVSVKTEHFQLRSFLY